MRQRAMIAMAIANEPRILIADEPTTALDVTIQAQIVEVMKAAQDETHAATILITHDLGLDRRARRSRRRDVRRTCRRARRRLRDLQQPEASVHGRAHELARATRCRSRVARSDPRPAPEHDLAASWLRISSAVRPLPGPRDAVEPRSLRCGLSARAASTSRRATSPRSSPRSTSSARSWRIRRERDPGADSGGACADEMTNGGDELLRVEGLVKHFPDQGRDLQAHGRTGGGRLRRRPLRPKRRDARHRRRVRVRQDDAGSDDHQADRADRRDGSSSTAAISPALKRKAMRPVRRDIQIVFQDPYASLNPRMTVRDIVGEPLRIHGLYRRQRRARAAWRSSCARSG